MASVPWLSRGLPARNYSLTDVLNSFDECLREIRVTEPVQILATGAYRLTLVGQAILFITNKNLTFDRRSDYAKIILSARDLQFPNAVVILHTREKLKIDYGISIRALRKPLFELVEAINYLPVSKLYAAIDDEERWLGYARRSLWFAAEYVQFVGFTNTKDEKKTLVQLAEKCKHPFVYIIEEKERWNRKHEELLQLYENTGFEVFCVSAAMCKVLMKLRYLPLTDVWFLNILNSPMFSLNVVEARSCRRKLNGRKAFDSFIDNVRENFLTLDDNLVDQALAMKTYSSCLLPCDKVECEQRQADQMRSHIYQEAYGERRGEPYSREFLVPSRDVRDKLSTFLQTDIDAGDYPDSVLRCE